MPSVAAPIHPITHAHGGGPSTSTTASTASSSAPSGAPKTFRQLRSSIGQTLRTAAGGRNKVRPSAADLRPPESSANHDTTLPHPVSIFAPRHKHSVSDTKVLLAAQEKTVGKGKGRASLDAPNVSEVDHDDSETRKESRSSGIFGLRRLESKVGLRKQSPSTSETQVTKETISSKQKAKDRDKGKDVEKPKDGKTIRWGLGNTKAVDDKTQKASGWVSFQAPSLSKASQSSPSLQQTLRANKVNASVVDLGPSHPTTQQRGDRTAKGVKEETVSGPPISAPMAMTSKRSPVSPGGPNTPSRSRASLSSPSSPALVQSPSQSSRAQPPAMQTVHESSQDGTSQLLTRTPSRVRPRLTAVHTAGTLEAASPGPSSPSTVFPHNPSTPNLQYTPPRSAGPGVSQQQPPSPSPTPIRPRARSPQLSSRPPLSPSASANAGLKFKLRAGSASASHLPLNASLSTSSSSTAVAAPPDRPIRAESRRRMSAGSPTGQSLITTERRPSLEAQRHTRTGSSGRDTPTSNSRSNSPVMTRGHRTKDSLKDLGTGADTEDDKSTYSPPPSPSPLKIYTKSRGSASATSLSHHHQPSLSPIQSQVSQASSPPSSFPKLYLSQEASSPSHRDIIRHAASLILRELGGPRPRTVGSPVPPATPTSPTSTASFHTPPSSPQTPLAASISSSIASLSPEVWSECEVRLRALTRSERVWTRPHAAVIASTSSASVNNAGLDGRAAAGAGEERERKVFADAMKDGYVLCQLINKLRPGTIARVDAREDGFVRTLNVTRCLAAATTLGVPAGDLFHTGDLVASSPESLYRVAKTVIALVRIAGDGGAGAGDDLDAWKRAGRKVLHGQGIPASPQLQQQKRSQTAQSSVAGYNPYGSSSRAAASTPNLGERSMSPVAMRGKGQAMMPALPTVRSDSPAEVSEESSSGSASGTTKGGLKAPPDVFFDLESSQENPPPSLSQSPRLATRINAPPHAPQLTSRTSIASTSTQATQGSDTTTYSSLLSARMGRTAGADSSTMFGTMRTATTDATSISPSDAPSFSRTEASSAAASLPPTGRSPPAEDVPRRRRSLDQNPHTHHHLHNAGHKITFPGLRERRPSENGAAADLTRVAEVDESKHHEEESPADASSSALKPKPTPIQLGKGKWPDDFITAFNAAPQSPRKPFEDEQTVTTTIISASPPRKFAVVGATNDSNDSLGHPQLPTRRPTHRPRHSIDTPGLLPKPLGTPRDTSPDSISPQPRLLPRRNSSRTAANRQGIYIPSTADLPEGSAPIPFPRSFSADHSASGSSEALPIAIAPSKFVYRGRFSSDVDGSMRRKPRPNSFDELGGRQGRLRFESMVNLGGGSSNASASDLMHRDRDSMDGSAVRQTLVVREEGKSPTHFQLANCIGRGQFGSVYRAMNLNTGQMVAVKRIRLEGLSEDEIKQLMREVDLVKRLSHPSIVKYEGMTRDSDTLSIVLEYAENGSLGQTLKAFGKLNERLVASYVIKILEGLNYLHRMDVVHCDLKAANILTTKTGNVKLTDFGVSLNLRQMEREIKNDVIGTPNWIAPEVIELKGASTSSDIWSLACTVIELLTGKPPYADMGNGMSVMFRIVEDECPPIPEEFSDSLKDFLKTCFQKDPTKRPSADVLGDHPWLKQTWGAHKELRPQDSIPFLRRVSADLQRSEAARMSAFDLPRADSRGSGSHPRSEEPPNSPLSSSPGLSSSPPRQVSFGPPGSEAMTDVREHSFIQTSVSKPVLCRVCMQTIQMTAMLCEECSLISHSRCAENAPPTCGLRAQLLQYAQYSPSGSPKQVVDMLARQYQPSPPISPWSGESVTSSSPTTDGPFPPPTAFKMLNPFKRSRSSLSFEPPASSQASSRDDPLAVPRPRKPSLLRRHNPKRESYHRPTSMASSEEATNQSSMRSNVNSGGSVSSHSKSHGHSRSESHVVKHQVSMLSARTGDTAAYTTNSRFSVAESDIRGAPSTVAATIEADELREEREEERQRERRVKKSQSKNSQGSNCLIQ